MTLSEKRELHAELLNKMRRLSDDSVSCARRASNSLEAYGQAMFELGELKAELVHLAVEIAKEEGNAG